MIRANSSVRVKLIKCDILWESFAEMSGTFEISIYKSVAIWEENLFSLGCDIF